MSEKFNQNIQIETQGLFHETGSQSADVSYFVLWTANYRQWPSLGATRFWASVPHCSPSHLAPHSSFPVSVQLPSSALRTGAGGRVRGSSVLLRGWCGVPRAGAKTSSTDTQTARSSYGGRKVLSDSITSSPQRLSLRGLFLQDSGWIVNGEEIGMRLI